MGLIEKKQELSPREKIPSPREKSLPLKEEKVDISGFREKPYLKREEFRRWLKRPDLYKISGLPEVERVKLEKELFGPESGRYGYYIERGEVKKVIKEMEKEKFQTKNSAEKLAIDKRIKILKKFLGK